MLCVWYGKCYVAVREIYFYLTAIYFPLQNFFFYSLLSAKFIEVNTPVSSILQV